MNEIAQLPEGETVSLLVRYRNGSTRLVSGRVATTDGRRAVVVTPAGEKVELLEGEIETLFRLSLG